MININSIDQIASEFNNFQNKLISGKLKGYNVSKMAKVYYNHHQDAKFHFLEESGALRSIKMTFQEKGKEKTIVIRLENLNKKPTAISEFFKGVKKKISSKKHENLNIKIHQLAFAIKDASDKVIEGNKKLQEEKEQDRDTIPVIQKEEQTKAIESSTSILSSDNRRSAVQIFSEYQGLAKDSLFTGNAIKNLINNGSGSIEDKQKKIVKIKLKKIATQAIEKKNELNQLIPRMQSLLEATKSLSASIPDLDQQSILKERLKNIISDLDQVLSYFSDTSQFIGSKEKNYQELIDHFEELNDKVRGEQMHELEIGWSMFNDYFKHKYDLLENMKVTSDKYMGNINQY